MRSICNVPMPFFFFFCLGKLPFYNGLQATLYHFLLMCQLFTFHYEDYVRVPLHFFFFGPCFQINLKLYDLAP